jgi:hypothetical protein
MRPEGLYKLIKFNYETVFRTRDLPACSIVSLWRNTLTANKVQVAYIEQLQHSYRLSVDNILGDKQRTLALEHFKHIFPFRDLDRVDFAPSLPDGLQYPPYKQLNPLLCKI